MIWEGEGEHGEVRVAIILIATGGEQYMKFVPPLVASLEKFFPPHDVVLFTDVEEVVGAPSLFAAVGSPPTPHVIRIPQPDLGWPRATLMRYHAMLAQGNLLSQYDQIFYMDIDMLVCSPVTGDDIFSEGLTAVIHAGYPDAFERRRKSTAFVEGHPMYYTGAFIGGNRRSFISMCETIAHNVDTDGINGIKAVWYDESHLNRYLVDNPPLKKLSPAYCFPEAVLNHVKIKHLEKKTAGPPAETGKQR